MTSIAVIGGGPMGLAVAYELCLQGHAPVLFEADDRLGGMAASFDFDGLQLERYYHFHCLSDHAFFEILEELNLSDQLFWRQTSMGFFFNNRLYSWGSVGSVLSFRHLPLLTRFRYLLHAARCLTIRDWRHLDSITATRWLRKWLGERGYQLLWYKLFAFKFFQFSDQISAAWIWSRVRRLGQSRKKLKETLGFLKGGSQQLVDALEASIRNRGGEIRCNSPVQSIQPGPEGGAKLQTPDHAQHFDRVISTVPLPLVAPMLETGGTKPELVNRYSSQPSVACACVVFQTSRAITGNFWTNVNDDRFAIPGVIEMSNLRPLSPHVSYVPFYIPADHPDYQRNNQAFIDDAWDCLKAINPDLRDEHRLASHCSRYRFAQPVCRINFQATLPPLEPYPGVITADTTVYYPEDRGISESVGYGRSLARRALANAAAAAP
ncbi:flavin containing amine oxidoreductase family protein [Synechococcus sp. BIOS-E4-1]|uniref:NAD(P)/FAD-dependent oxidoreductase n=1 Tax=Synechococcus sp. BIOS-E4-1 TaxID=1400864 RepID=UPI0016459857|nr:NAD(P)/FAD-dependent oxidoreductase [Synechococcus sp. BIOS-E4-1]QNI52783.1 flavin containing amine oxidoreductase family protein [Synechococcus sp. BIOS-E4-1]